MMPWHIKRMLLIFACGFAALGLAIVVFVRHASLDTDLLACIGFAGGVAIILSNLPENGKDDYER